jgi:hypothetical protein
MRKRTSSALAIATVVAGIAAMPITNGALSALSVRQSGLSLTHREKSLAWRDLHRQAIRHYGVPWFATIDRWVLPPNVRVKPVTRSAARDVPPLGGYDFAIVAGRLLIVKPTDHAVADVIAPPRRLA